MFLKLLFALSILPLAWTIWSWICLYRNWLIVRKTGLPYRLNPVNHANPLWMAGHKLIIPIFEKVPFGTGSFTRYNKRGWDFSDRYRAFEEMGEAMAIVTPGDIFVYVCEPDAIADIFRRKLEFPRPLKIFGLTKCFGDNIVTVPDKQWQKHRKVTATAFNDRNNELVWTESVQQGHDMVHHWAAQKAVTNTANDARTMSLNVLSCAGFGKPYPFKGESSPEESNPDDYKKSLQFVLENLLLLFALGTKNISKSWMPEKVVRMHNAMQVFQSYMTNAYEGEKDASGEATVGQANLMSSLVKASKGHAGLTESEIYGNSELLISSKTQIGIWGFDVPGWLVLIIRPVVFLFNFAGHDTTASTFTFAIYLLATQPNVQDWLHEELQHVFGDRPHQEWKYEDYSRLKRCLAIFYETTRLFTPSPMAKSTGAHPAELTVGDKTYVIPPNAIVLPAHHAVHTHPKYWGADSLEWKPSRWIESSTSGSLDDEEFKAPRKGQFIAWSEGHQNCLGKKFSQVELVAAVSAVFRNWKVKPAVKQGENLDQARKRVWKQINEDTDLVVLLQMLHPEKAPLVWERR